TAQAESRINKADRAGKNTTASAGACNLQLHNAIGSRNLASLSEQMDFARCRILQPEHSECRKKINSRFVAHGACSREQLSIKLESNHGRFAEPHARTISCVQRPIAVEPGQTITVLLMHPRESAREVDLAVIPREQCLHATIEGCDKGLIDTS